VRAIPNGMGLPLSLRQPGEMPRRRKTATGHEKNALKAKGCRLAGALAGEPASAREGIEEEDPGDMDVIEVDCRWSVRQCVTRSMSGIRRDARMRAVFRDECCLGGGE
jgi:hypothetical protein